MKMNKFCYTISIFHLQSFLSKEYRDMGFKKIVFYYHTEICHGVLTFSTSITQEILDQLKKDGLHFVEINSSVPTECLINFIYVDGCYYNYLESDYKHSENPFQIKTFSFESFEQPPSEECPTTVMNRNKNFTHITGLEDEIFLFTKHDYCHYCSKKKKVLNVMDKCQLCLGCMTQMF